jgi:hypothetical protein
LRDGLPITSATASNGADSLKISMNVSRINSVISDSVMEFPDIGAIPVRPARGWIEGEPPLGGRF